MNILCTNDDGVFAEGIRSLHEILSEKHNVYLIAPSKERSACSCAITVRHEVKVESLEENVYAVDGYPADCVNIGLHTDLVPQIDLVISGINHGPNLGEDIYFSGTVAGARTAQIFGVSGLAVSLDCHGTSPRFIQAARFIADFIETNESSLIPGPLCLNINYPDIEKDTVQGVKYTCLGKRVYRDAYKINSNNDKVMSLQLVGSIVSGDISGSDVSELKNGYISITPLKIDCTDYDRANILSSAENIWLK